MDKNRSLEVCLSPELIGQFDLSGKIAVVVDILRATSCFTAGISSGVPPIIPFLDLEDCRSMKIKNYLIAGERNGAKVDGFDLGNSPFDYIEAAKLGKPVAVTTTNGTTALSVSNPADQVLVGAFLNISATSAYLRTTSKSIVIVCAGWKGKVNLEDTLYAGALAEQLKDRFTLKEDAVMVALNTFQSCKSNLLGSLEKSSHVKRLQKLNIKKDIEFCIKRDIYSDVVGLKEDKIQLL
jgi:2-phosphosulfolactate phosphatase